MSSCSVEYKRKEFPGKSDSEVAEATALKYGFVTIVRYKNSLDGDYTDFGCCINDRDINNYLNSSYCHAPEIIYDARANSLYITEESLLASKCEICGAMPTSDALVFASPMNFYFCPQCALFFCPACYNSRLPLSEETSGYGVCPGCKHEVQRALPGDYGKVPLHPPGLRSKLKRKKWKRVLFWVLVIGIASLIAYYLK
ncbi:MAG: hypothetical protein GY801_04205 [bacterium]|nr:hypothetical protein [bacterium]